MRRSFVAILLASAASGSFGTRQELDLTPGIAAVRADRSDLERSRLRRGGHIICPVLNAWVQNGDLTTLGENVDADTVVEALMRGGLNSPSYSGTPLPPGITQSNAFEYTFGIFLKNKAANYRDTDGALTLPIYNFGGTMHEHNSHTGITTTPDVPFDSSRWEMLAGQADSQLPDGRGCFSRDAWARAMMSFERRSYDGKTEVEIDTNKVRSDHPIFGPAGSWGGSALVAGLLHRAAANGNQFSGKRLVAGVSQVYNGMINLFWTGDYGNVDLDNARARMLETEEGQKGLSFPWLDADFCLPVDELKALLVDGRYPTSSGYTAMPRKEFKQKGKVFKFAKSRCQATYFKEGGKGYVPEDACIDGEPPLVDGLSWVQRKLLHTLLGKTDPWFWSEVRRM